MMISTLHRRYDRRIIFQLLRFSLIGGLATIIHWFVASLVYKYSGLNLNLSILIGWSFAVFVSFFGHCYLTFVHSSKVGLSVFWRFFVASMFGFLVGQLIAIVGSKWPVYYQYAIVLSAIFPAFISFFLGKLWVFK
ncbi:GtrA family protein [Parapusillimonas sp. JC17]|uniref:GtrA family protein n=1 Tax=Parapusillimonas sp. JC17 TaxID=3445768 RepID=UPI003F9FE923